jgi:lipopolysaccharide export LptBFGC system permease protein LptF
VRILERYVAAEVLKTFFFALLVFSAVFFVGIVYSLFRQDFSPGQILAVLPYAFPYSLPFLIPVSLLVGCSLALGRLGADNELVPIVTGGVHPIAVALPAVFLGAALSAVVYGLEATLIPYWYHKSRDLKREFIETLLTLGEGTDKRISDGRKFNLFARRFHGRSLEGLTVVLAAGGGGESPHFLGAGGGEDAGESRPIEIVAERGEVRTDDARDALLLVVENATVTTFRGLDAPTATAEPDVAPGGPPARTPENRKKEPKQDPAKLDIPKEPRGPPQRIDIERATIVLSNEYKRQTREQALSSRALSAFRRRIAAWRAYAASSAPRHAGPGAGAEIAGALAAAGGGPGTLALAVARTAAIAPGGGGLKRIDRVLSDIDETLHERGAVSLAPLVFAMVGTAVPLLLRHNNRLVPFFASFAIVTATFFVPFLAARSLAGNSLPPQALYAPVAFTLLAGAALFARVARL